MHIFDLSGISRHAGQCDIFCFIIDIDPHSTGIGVGVRMGNSEFPFRSDNLKGCIESGLEAHEELPGDITRIKHLPRIAEIDPICHTRTACYFQWLGIRQVLEHTNRVNPDIP